MVGYSVVIFVSIFCYGFSASISDSHEESFTYDTIVIGLGASGTMAATTLARAGRRVLALEAQDRIGGRVYTVPFSDGIAELGAEWIHGSQPSIVYDLAIKNNISIVTDTDTSQGYFSNGTKIDKVMHEDLMNYAMEAYYDPPLDKEPQSVGHYVTGRVKEYLKQKYPDLSKDEDFVTELLAYLDFMVNTNEASDSWNDVTTHSSFEELQGEHALSWHRYGYKTLFEIMMNTYNNGTGLPTLDYKLNAEVAQIKWSEDRTKKVEVTCVDGRTFTADNVIVTASIGVLKARHDTLFSPKLPEDKIRAIEHIRMGVLGKITLQFPEKWWEDRQFFGFFWRGEDKNALNRNVWTKIAAASKPQGSNNTLTVWTTGKVAAEVEALPDDVVKRQSIELLKRFMGANVTIPEPINMLRTYWHTNPFTRGSYTYDHFGFESFPTARAVLAEPLVDSERSARVLFAGEATNSKHFGTVHGAAESGYREADRILKALIK